MNSKFTVMRKEATAGFLAHGNHICLAIKQKKVGAGLWMPYGGIVEPGESYEDCMIRELREEMQWTPFFRQSLDKFSCRFFIFSRRYLLCKH